MALEEQGQQSVWEFIKKLLKKSLNVLTNTAKEKADKAIEKHQYGSIGELAKKNPNMGIQEELGLSKELADEIGKELKKMHQDFVKEKYTDIDGAEKWKISVTSGNKSLVENLKKKLEAKLQDKGQSIDEQIQKAREKAAERNKATQRKMPTPEKHKEQDGMSL